MRDINAGKFPAFLLFCAARLTARPPFGYNIQKQQGEKGMVRVLFVCLGNICRSPMGEFILKDEAARRGVADRLEIASAGTSGEEEGNPVYPPARAQLAKHGIRCDGKRARRLRLADGAAYDYILCMEEANARDARRICGADAPAAIVRLLDYSARPRDIADPWWTRDFAKAYADIAEGCAAFLDYLAREGKLA